jgi:hypothetical protein
MGPFSTKGIIAIVLIIGIGVGVWVVGNTVDIVEIMDLDANAVRAETDALESSLVGDITALRAIDLNTVLFEIEEYTLLVDKRIVVQEQPVQNTMPFAPLPQ